MPSFGFSCTGGFSCFVNLCAGVSEVPFGRSRCRFNVLLWVSEMRVVFVRGGRPNGMVQLLVETVSLSGAFAKTTALAVACLWPDWGRESIIGGWCSSGFAAREKGTGEGIGLFAAKWVDGSDGRARGMEVEMFFAMRAYAIRPYMWCL